MRPPAFGPTTGISSSVSYNVACSPGAGAAVQWHPELTAADDLTQQRLFDALAEAASALREGPP